MRSRHVTLMGFVALLLVAAVAGSARAGDPPGNNGTVRVNGDALDGPGNDAHVGCAFQIEFRGFDQGDLLGIARVELVPPSGRAGLVEQAVWIGEDAAGGATDLDALMDVDLFDPIAATGAGAQAGQGFHVRLTVSAEGSIGADTKHKTFWADCGGEGSPG